MPPCATALPPGYTGPMNVLRLALLALACSTPLLAAAQWQWLDDGGRKVFSDTAPPANVPANRILRQPGQRPAQVPESPVADLPTAAVPAAGAVAVPSAGQRAPGKDKALEDRKKQAEAAEAAKAKAEEQKLAQAQADNCTRAKAGKADLASGVRIGRTNAKGEREIMDDKAREAEGKRLDTVIARDCKPAAQ